MRDHRDPHTHDPARDRTARDRRDIVDEIDALTRDAATWTVPGSHEPPEWNTPSAGTMPAILLEMAAPRLVELNHSDPMAEVTRLVGDPVAEPISYLYGVWFWIGDNSMATAPVNPGATRFLHHLLTQVRDGDYVASDHERDHVTRLLATPGAVPVIHGPCLITGATTRGEPTELGENFQQWFTTFLDRLAPPQALSGDLIETIAEALGIGPDQLQVIVVEH